ncbi:hypothetical protein M8494_11595 [Serratia ureilytica]
MQAHGRGPQGEFEAQYHYDALGRRSLQGVALQGQKPNRRPVSGRGHRLRCRSSATTAAAAAELRSASPRGARWRRWSRRATAARQIFTGITPTPNSAPLEVTDAGGQSSWST